MRSTRHTITIIGAITAALLAGALAGAASATKEPGTSHPRRESDGPHRKTIKSVHVLVQQRSHTHRGRREDSDRDRAKRGERGRGARQAKVTLCHRRRVTITVSRRAVRAHLRHGDTRGACRSEARTATLTVIKHVINDNGGTKSAGDFILTIHGVDAVGANSFHGSEAGVTKTLRTLGSFSVSEQPVSGYTMSTSGDCSGTIAAGEHKTCTITNNDVAAPTPATLTVIKHVINDNGGTKSAGDFVLTIHGVDAVGANSFHGSEAGVTKTLRTLGSFSVSEQPVSGYTMSTSGDCSGTIAAGEHKTCTITNNDT